MKLIIYYFMLISVAIHKYGTNADEAQDFLESIREKIRNLEATGQIIRDYQPYRQTKIQDDEEYDFIIVGAGSGGSAVIHRLSEVSHWKILVLEAGGEPEIFSDIPFISTLSHLTSLNWEFYTETEPNFALGLENQRMHWPRGKGLGGTSLLNYMIFSRGVKEDYDRWARLGNPGWSYEEVLPYFKKLETCKIEGRDEEYRGNSGPIFAEDMYITKAGDVFVEAAENMGYDYIDYNGAKHIGVSHCQGTTKNGFRCSGERGYIKPIKNRKNLTIRTHCHVTKVLIEDNCAHGVEFVNNGKTYRARAKKEVILSAGVLNSAHILLLSGIGPKKQLSEFGIESIKHLPVGQKIYDHPVYFGLSFTINDTITYNVTAALQDQAFIELYRNGTGLLHDLGTAESLIFAKTQLATNNLSDIELIFLSTDLSKYPNLTLAKVARISEKVYDKLFRPYENQTAVTCCIVLMHPESFGHLELQSSDPLVYPKIYSGYFSDPNGKDVKTMIAGIREAMRVMLSPPFDKYGIKLIDVPMPGCEDLPNNSDEYWECALRHITSTLFHHTSTCKMGPPTDAEAVVDHRLKVYGIENLRVADTSVIPIQLTGHTNVPAFMVGEKAADMIKEDYLFEKSLEQDL